MNSGTHSMAWASFHLPVIGHLDIIVYLTCGIILAIALVAVAWKVRKAMSLISIGQQRFDSGDLDTLAALGSKLKFSALQTHKWVLENNRELLVVLVKHDKIGMLHGLTFMMALHPIAIVEEAIRQGKGEVYKEFIDQVLPTEEHDRLVAQAKDVPALAAIAVVSNLAAVKLGGHPLKPQLRDYRK